MEDRNRGSVKGGMGRKMRMVWEGGDMCVPTADSC